MNSKYKFGLTEVVAMIAGSIVVVLLELVFKNLNISYSDVAKAIILVCVSAIFGYSSGLVVAIASTLLTAAILGTGVNPIVIFAFVIVAFSIGYYAPRFGIRDGMFDKKLWLDFAAVKLMAEIVAWLFLTPLFEFMISRNDLFGMLRFYFMRVIMLTITDVVILPILIIVNKEYGRKNI